MLKIDSGERVIKIDPARISKITQAWRADKLADVYEEGEDTPSQSLSIEEALAFLPKTYDPERCHFRGIISATGRRAVTRLPLVAFDAGSLNSTLRRLAKTCDPKMRRARFR